MKIYNPPNLTTVLNTGMTKTSPTRSLNTDFIPNTTKWTFVLYSTRISGSASITITGVSSISGRIELLAAATSPSSPTDLICQSRSSTTFSGAVIVGIAVTINTPEEGLLCAWVPPNYTVRLATTNETGTPTYTIVKSTEWTLG